MTKLYFDLGTHKLAQRHTDFVYMHAHAHTKYTCLKQKIAADAWEKSVVITICHTAIDHADKYNHYVWLTGCCVLRYRLFV